MNFCDFLPFFWYFHIFLHFCQFLGFWDFMGIVLVIYWNFVFFSGFRKISHFS